MTLPAWAAIIINWNGAADLPACLAALRAQTWPAAEVVVVDNRSNDDSLAVLAAHPWVRVLAQQENLGFAGGANAGIRATVAPLVATLNPDVTLRPDWAATLGAAFATDDQLGAAGGKLLYPDGRTIQHAGGRLERPSLVSAHIGWGELDTGQYEQAGAVDFVTGGALLLRRAALATVGLFDEGFYPAYYEDVDLCLRLRAGGWAVRYVPAAVGWHRESASVDARGAAYYRMIHGGRLRLATRHLPLGQLVGEFLPHEVTRLAADLQHLTGPLAADRAGLTSFPAGLLGATSSGASPTEPLRDAPAALALPGGSLTERLHEVRRRWLVEERPFQSALPVVGRLVAWLRTRLNNAGPRWYVRAILAQQVEFNAVVTRALEDTAQAAQAATLSTQATGIVLATRLEELAARQALLIEQLRSLSERLATLEAGAASGARPMTEGADSLAASAQPAPGQQQADAE